MRILCIDPGVTTGIAMRIGSSPHPYRTLVAKSAEEVWKLLFPPPWDLVICERFATAGRISKYGLYTVRLVGGLEALCWDRHIPFVLRTPSQRRFAQEAAKLYLKGTKHVIHEEDALAHLLAYERSIETSALHS